MRESTRPQAKHPVLPNDMRGYAFRGRQAAAGMEHSGDANTRGTDQSLTRRCPRTILTTRPYTTFASNSDSPPVVPTSCTTTVSMSWW